MKRKKTMEINELFGHLAILCWMDSRAEASRRRRAKKIGGEKKRGI
jgi:hypothetical protein